jgi:tRNA modification GTPase
MAAYRSLQDDPIAALATPLGESALAIIRVSGAGSIGRLADGFSRAEALRSAEGNRIVYGWLRSGNENIDEVTLGVFRAPRSYTGEESVEIYCHGSVPGISRIMSLLFSLGFRQAEPGEFTLRAFLNGKMDLTSAEAVHELVKSRSAMAQGLALHRLSGGVFREIDRVKSRLTDIMAAVSVQLDYPDDELPGEDDDSGFVASLIDPSLLEDAREGLERLSGSYRSGRLYQEGARVALAGRTNAGKSSLFNLFLKEDRSIVSDIHGTTRDYIEAPVDLSGIPIRLFDTAGLRDVDEIIEAEGIRRSGEIIENSSVILYLVDGSEEGAGSNSFDEKQLDRIAELNLPCVRVWTKSDKPGAADPPEGYLPLSVIKGEGFAEIQDEMRRLLTSGLERIDESSVVIDSMRQKHLIDDAVKSLEAALDSLAASQPLDIIAMDLQNCLRDLGEITGEVSSEDILDRVFSGFCVGK